VRTIGLIGGLSWESSAEYYRIINEAAQRRLGGVHSARSLMYSFNFGEIEALQHAGNWPAAEAMMIDAARRLERGGAELLVICSNTMHLMAEAIERATAMPLLHIADPTGVAIAARGHRRVALLGTAFTMEKAFYRERLERRFGLEVLIPGDRERADVHEIIYRELVKGEVHDASRRCYQETIEALAARGAEAVILGCTEIMLLVKPEDSVLPVFDTTTLHAEAALHWALAPQAAQARA
jgi:aspartate racemase